LYRYFVSQSSEFCRYNPLRGFSSACCCKRIFRYRLSPESFGYTLVSSSPMHTLSVGTFVYVPPHLGKVVPVLFN